MKIYHHKLTVRYLTLKQTERISENPDDLKKLNTKFAEKKAKLIAQHQINMDKHLREQFDKVGELSVTERQALISLIISEKFKAPMQEKFVSDMLSYHEGISIMGFEIVQPVYATCSTQPDVTVFKQLDVDITGKIGFHG